MPWSVAFMVVAIVTVTMIARVLRERHRSIASQPAPVDTASRDEIRQLKERIQVLERVVTDERKSLDLDREIDRLRDR